jgi:hypothetical protein
MSYVIAGLDPAPFAPLYGLSDADLAVRGGIRMAVTGKPGFPCRITLEDAEPGETVLLLNHEHAPFDTPYRARHAIFVREGAETAAVYENEIPGQLAIRLLSVRAFDAAGMMVDAEVIEGTALDALAREWLKQADVDSLHVHYAKRGCFAARITRAG